MNVTKKVNKVVTFHIESGIPFPTSRVKREVKLTEADKRELTDKGLTHSIQSSMRRTRRNFNGKSVLMYDHKAITFDSLIETHGIEGVNKLTNKLSAIADGCRARAEAMRSHAVNRLS